MRALTIIKAKIIMKKLGFISIALTIVSLGFATKAMATPPERMYAPISIVPITQTQRDYGMFWADANDFPMNLYLQRFTQLPSFPFIGSIFYQTTSDYQGHIFGTFINLLNPNHSMPKFYEFVPAEAADTFGEFIPLDLHSSHQSLGYKIKGLIANILTAQNTLFAVKSNTFYAYHMPVATDGSAIYSNKEISLTPPKSSLFTWAEVSAFDRSGQYLYTAWRSLNKHVLVKYRFDAKDLSFTEVSQQNLDSLTKADQITQIAVAPDNTLLIGVSHDTKKATDNMNETQLQNYFTNATSDTITQEASHNYQASSLSSYPLIITDAGTKQITYLDDLGQPIGTKTFAAAFDAENNTYVISIGKAYKYAGTAPDHQLPIREISVGSCGSVVVA